MRNLVERCALTFLSRRGHSTLSFNSRPRLVVNSLRFENTLGGNRMNIKNYKELNIRLLQQIRTSKRFSKQNKTLIEEYSNIKRLEVTEARIQIILNSLNTFSRHSKNLLEEVQEYNKIASVFSKLANETIKGNRLRSKTTIHQIYKVVRQVARHYNDGETPKGLKKLKLPKEERRKLTVNDMITLEDISNIGNGLYRDVDYGLIIQFEAGLRPSELLGLNYEDITILKNGWARINVEGTKNESSLRSRHINTTVPYLKQWLEKHPNKKSGQPLFVGLCGNRMSYPNIRKRFRIMMTQVGINKPNDIYNLRHSSIVLMKKRGMPASLSKMEFGHSSQIYNEVYGRLAPDDSLNILKGCYGIESDTKEEMMNPKTCNSCLHINEIGKLFCKCGEPLSGTAHSENKEISILKEQVRMLQERFMTDVSQRLAT